MNVFFDFEVDPDPLYEKANVLTIEYQKILKDFVEQRINVLKEDIEHEELREDEYGEENKRFTLLWRRENTSLPVGIHFLGYSELLIEKMKSCFTPEDIKYLHSRFLNLF